MLLEVMPLVFSVSKKSIDPVNTIGKVLVSLQLVDQYNWVDGIEGTGVVHEEGMGVALKMCI